MLEKGTMKTILSLSVAVLSVLPFSASAEPVLARVLEASGSIQATHAGGPLQAGATLPVGASITTGPASKITFNAFPGSVVSCTAQTQATVVSMEVSRAAGVVHREATFKLDAGLLFFAVDKVNWENTQFQVLTPGGTVLAKKPELPKTATAGIVEVKDGQIRVAAQAGRMECTGPNGATFAVPGGAVLSSTGQGFQVVDLTSGQTTVYDGSGTITATRTAANGELTSAAEAFSKGAEVTETLIAGGVIGQELSAAVRETLITVNQRLAELGMEPAGTAQVGALPGAAASQPLPTSSGFPSGSVANPANSAGPVNSPEL